jgi:hypothetical protein
MANLTQKEFQEAVALLAEAMGLQRLRDKLVRFNGLVTRRRAASPESLADQLYMLSGGLRRQVPATFAFYAVWNEQLHDKLGEEGEEHIEKLAEAVNVCLDEHDGIVADKEAEIDGALGAYQAALAEAAGPAVARLDMLLKAVPAVATRLRATPPAAEPTDAA